MPDQRIKIKSPTVAFERPGEGGKIIHIPAGSKIRVIGEESDGNKLVSVEWNNRNVSMFARDLVDRGEPISEGDGSADVLRRD